MPEAIVCGVDNSEAADKVADTARWFADRLGARLVLVHVVEEETDETERLLTSMRVRLSLGTRDDVRLAEGAPAESLIDSAKQERASFLVVGSRGRGPLRAALFGSVSRALATSAPCPVVIVPDDVRLQSTCEDGDDQASVICGIDGSEHALAAARLGSDLSARTGLRLVLVLALPVDAALSHPSSKGAVSAFSVPSEALVQRAEELVKDAVKAVGDPASGIVEAGQPWDVLEAVADREGGKLLVVGARGLSSLEGVVFGSVAARVAATSRRPVIVLPESAEDRVHELRPT